MIQLSLVLVKEDTVITPPTYLRCSNHLRRLPVHLQPYLYTSRPTETTHWLLVSRSQCLHLAMFLDSLLEVEGRHPYPRVHIYPSAGQSEKKIMQNNSPGQ